MTNSKLTYLQIKLAKNLGKFFQCLFKFGPLKFEILSSRLLKRYFGNARSFESSLKHPTASTWIGHCANDKKGGGFRTDKRLLFL